MPLLYGAGSTWFQTLGEGNGRFEATNKPTGYEIYKFLVTPKNLRKKILGF